MSTRFKSEEQCYTQGNGSNGMTICGMVDVPIQEWQFLPAVQGATYTTGEAAPTGKYIDVLFPELHLWSESHYDNYVYKVSVSYDNSDTEWLSLSSTNLTSGVFSPNNLSSTRVNLIFTNLGNLLPGVYTGNIIFEAFGIDENGVEQYVETQSVPVTLTVIAGENEGVVTDKEIYNITFNKSTNILSGDTDIIIFTNDPEQASWVNQPYNLTVNVEDFSNKRVLHLSFFSATAQGLEVGTYSQPFLIEVAGVGKNVTVNLQVVDNANDFGVSPVSFDFMVQQNPGEIQTGTITIDNPNNIELSIAASPSFVENVTLMDGFVTFTTKDSSTLGLGDYSGAIVIQSESVSKTINIDLKVVQVLDSDFTGSPYYFALDKNKIAMQKTLSAAIYVKMTLQMYYKGFDDEYTETQTYDFPYFKNKAEIYPGGEVQNFNKDGKVERLVKIFAMFYLQKREKLSKINLDRRVVFFKYLDIRYIYGFYLLFISFWKFLTSNSIIQIDGKEIDLTLLFTQSNDNEVEVPYTELGLRSTSHQIAESGVFGTMKELNDTNAWEILINMYDMMVRNVKRTAEMEKNK